MAGGEVSPQDWGVGPADPHSASSNDNGQHLDGAIIKLGDEICCL